MGPPQAAFRTSSFLKGCVAMTSSASDFGRDHGLIHEAVITGRKAGWGPDEWAKLAHDEEKMRQFRQVLLGHASIHVIEHLIDCDAAPFVPDGWKVEEHQKGGAWKWSPTQVEFYLDKRQQGGKYIEGNKLRKALEGKNVLNANILDYLLKNPHLIPEDWKKDGNGNTRYIFFWGTVYRDSDGNLYVRCLYWRDGRWRWSYGWLGSDWRSDRPAVVRAS